MDKEEARKKAIELVNAYFDGKNIVMKDPEAEWTSSRLLEISRSVL